MNPVGTRSSAAVDSRQKNGTRWNASLPGSEAQGAIPFRGALAQPERLYLPLQHGRWHGRFYHAYPHRTGVPLKPRSERRTFDLRHSSFNRRNLWPSVLESSGGMVRNASTETNPEPHRRDKWKDRAGTGGGLGGSAALVTGTGSTRSCQVSAWRRLTLTGATRSNSFATSGADLSCQDKTNKCRATGKRILLTDAPVSAVIRAQENRNQLTPVADAACRGLSLTVFGIMRLAHHLREGR
jgi:hypothetical protein